MIQAALYWEHVLGAMQHVALLQPALYAVVHNGSPSFFVYPSEQVYPPVYWTILEDAWIVVVGAGVGDAWVAAAGPGAEEEVPAVPPFL